MTNVNTENNGSKKKYLVPLIVLLLCGVAMTGAAYAYSSNASSSGNVITSDAELLTISEGKSATKTVEFGVDYTSSTADGTTTWSIDTAHSDLSETFKLTLQSSTKESKVVTLTIGTIAIGSTTFTPTVTVKDASNATVAVTTTDGKFTFTMTPTGEEGEAGEQTVTVTIDITAPSTVTAPDMTKHSATFTITAATADSTHTE